MKEPSVESSSFDRRLVRPERYQIKGKERAEANRCKKQYSPGTLSPAS
jgi:hypothetical protein